MDTKDDIKNKFASFFGETSSEEDEALSDLEAPQQDLVFSSDEEPEERPEKPKKHVLKKRKTERKSSTAFVDEELQSSSDDDEEKQPKSYKTSPQLNASAELEKLTKKPKRDKKSDLDAQIAQDTQIEQLIKRMGDAAEEDYNSMEVGKPATKKYELLPKVVSLLTRQDYHEGLLEGGICSALRLWLEPYHDGSLPGLDIRKVILELLQSLHIDKYQLKESGLGRIIKTLSVHPQETQENKKSCQKLIYHWSVNIMNSTGKHTMDYRAFVARQERESRNQLRMKRQELNSEDDETANLDLNVKTPPQERSKKIFPMVPTSNLPRSNSGTGILTAANTPDKYKKLLGHMQKLQSHGKSRSKKF